MSQGLALLLTLLVEVGLAAAARAIRPARAWLGLEGGGLRALVAVAAAGKTGYLGASAARRGQEAGGAACSPGASAGVVELPRRRARGAYSCGCLALGEQRVHPTHEAVHPAEGGPVGFRGGEVEAGSFRMA